jgi:hypothetical protein
LVPRVIARFAALMPEAIAAVRTGRGHLAALLVASLVFGVAVSAAASGQPTAVSGGAPDPAGDPVELERRGPEPDGWNLVDAPWDRGQAMEQLLETSQRAREEKGKRAERLASAASRAERAQSVTEHRGLPNAAAMALLGHS